MNEPRQADSLFQPEDQPAPAALEPIYIHLALTDPEVVAAVGEYPAGQARTEFVNTCVKIGVLSLRAAKGVVDGDAIRTAGDHLIGQLSERLTGYREALEDKVSTTLGHYFDPASGLFQVRVENLTKADGDLARVIQAQVGAAQAELDKTFERFLGENSAFLALLEPGEGNRLLAALRATVDEVARTEKDAIIAQFTLDDPQSALSRLVRELTASHGEVGKALKEQIDEVIKEFSLDNEGGALSRLVGRVEEAQTAISQEFSLDNDESALSRMRRGLQDQLNDLTNRQATFQQEVLAQLTAMTTRREAEAKSTTHGAVFEEAVGEYLRALGTPAGDIVEASGLTTGTVRSSKVGDYVVTLPPDSAAAGARIVVEAKEDKSYTLKASLEEADVARRNRSSGVCLFVHSARTAPAGMEPLSRFGSDVLVIWDPDDRATDVVFRAGYLTAKALSVRAALHSKSEAASWAKIDKAIEAIRKGVGGFDEMKTSSETITSSASKILDRIRIMRGDLERQLEILSDQIGGLRDDDEAGE